LSTHDGDKRQQESEGLSKGQIEPAKITQVFQAKVGHPTAQDLKRIIQSNQIVNYPVTAADIDRAKKIFGPSLPILKGKTTLHTPLTAVSGYVAVPPQIMPTNQHVSLSGDLVFVSVIPFFALLC
jgi:hypothetical protein